MPIGTEEFKKLRRAVVKGFFCTCGAKIIIGALDSIRCWKCKALWKVSRQSNMAILTGFVRNKICKRYHNWSTNNLGQCKRKTLCSTANIECNAVEHEQVMLVKFE